MLQTKKYYTYQIGKYIYEIDVRYDLTEIWIYNEDYGVKQQIIGIPEKWEENQIIEYIETEHKRNSYIYKLDMEE